MPCEGWWESWLEGGVGTTWSRRAAGGALGGLRGRVADRGLCSEGLPARDAELGVGGNRGIRKGQGRLGSVVRQGPAEETGNAPPGISAERVQCVGLARWAGWKL